MQFEVGDHVRHKPSGEEWLLGKATDVHVWPLGWPPCRAMAADCDLIERPDFHAKRKIIEQLRESNWVAV